jgi:hypothetical protein
MAIDDTVGAGNECALACHCHCHCRARAALFCVERRELHLLELEQADYSHTVAVRPPPSAQPVEVATCLLLVVGETE